MTPNMKRNVVDLAFVVISTGGEKSFFVFFDTIMPVENRYYVYLMTNWNHRVMYLGVTNDLARRVYEHKNKLVKGFTEKYNINKLVYFEETADVLSAIAR